MTLPPGVAVMTPSVLVIARSDEATSVSVSVALLFAGFGSPATPVTVAVLESDPEAAAEIVHKAV